MTDAVVVSLQGSILGWYGIMGEEIGQPNYNNLRSINEGIGNSIHLDAESFYEGGFIYLLNVHNIYIYIHSTNPGHYNSIGVRGERTIIKQVPVPLGLGYLIPDSVVAPHDKIDVSRQLIKTVQFSSKNVHGNVIDLHGAHVSWSLIFVTMG